MELIKKIFDYLLITIILISTNSIYVNSGYKLTPLLLAIVGISFLIKLVTIKLPSNYLKKIFFIFGTYYFVIITLVLLHFEFVQIVYYFLLFPFIILLILMESYGNSLGRFLDKFIQVILVMVTISLFFWFFGSILKIISPTDYVLNAWSDGIITPSYYNIYFETQVVSFLGNHFIRNSGVYAEGPMWNLMLSLALMIQTLLLPKNNKREFLLILTIFTVASTTGIIIVGVLLIYKVLIYLKGLQKFISFTTLPLIFFGLIQVIDDKANSTSSNIRLDDFFAGISAWKDSILFGSGFSNGLKVMESYMTTSIRPNMGNSDSLVLILAQGGIFLGALYFFPMLKILFSKKCSLNLKIFTVLFFVILVTSIFVDTPLFALMIAIFYAWVLENPYPKVNAANLLSKKEY